MSSVSKDIRDAIADVVIAAKAVVTTAAISEQDEYYWVVPDHVFEELFDALNRLRSLRGEA